MLYRKYEFDNEQQARELLEGFTQIHLGHIALTDGEYTEDGEVITEPILSDKWAVDVLIPKQLADSLKSFEVWPTNPKHHIGGWEKQYHKDRLKHNGNI